MGTYLMKIALWVVCYVEIFMCFWLVDIFFDIKKYLNKKKLMIVILCVVIMGSLLSINRQLLFFSNNMWMLSMVVVGLMAVCVLKRYILLVIELVVICISVIALLDFSVLYVIESLFVTNSWSNIYEGALSWWSVMIFAITRGIGICLLRIAHKILGWEVNKVLLQKILVPITVIVCVLVRFFQTLWVLIARDGMELRSWSVGIVVVSCLVLFLFVAIFLYKSISLGNENNILQMRDTMQEKRYSDLKRQSEGNKQLVHDIRNHIVTLQGLSKINDMEAIATYLQDLNGMIDDYEDLQWCDNSIINSILNQKLKMADEGNISFDIKSVPHIDLPLRESEIVAVFGNLLDNAIEACHKVVDNERKIYLKMKQRHGVFRLEIVNTIQSKPTIKDNLIETTKDNKAIHGYGLKNVARVIEKHQGVMSLEATEQIFKASVLIFCKKREVD